VLAATADLEDYAYFANPSWSAARKDREERARRKQQLTRGLAVAAVMTVLTLAYPAYAKSRETAAKSALTTAKNQLDAQRLGVRFGETNDNVSSKVRGTQTGNVDWCSITNVIAGVDPNVSITSLELSSIGASSGGAGVKVKSQLVIPANIDPSVALKTWAAYQNTLADKLDAQDVRSNGVSSASTGSSVQFEYSLAIPRQPQAGKGDERAEVWRTAEQACGTEVKS